MNTKVIKFLGIGALCMATGVSLANTSISNRYVIIKNQSTSEMPITVFYKIAYRNSMQEIKPHYTSSSQIIVQKGHPVSILVPYRPYKYSGVEVYQMKAGGHVITSTDLQGHHKFAAQGEAGACTYAFNRRGYSGDMIKVSVYRTKHKIILSCGHH